MISHCAICTILLFFVALSFGQQCHWDYTDPSQWGTICNGSYPLCASGTEQSPIDIKEALVNKNLKPLIHIYQQGNATLLNNGHTIQVNYPPGSFLEGGALTEQFQLLQFHFHTFAEHTFGSQFRKCVIHFVHASQQGELAVVGLTFEIGYENMWLQKIVDLLPQVTQPNTNTTVLINAQEVMPSDPSFYHYAGSLTTPPCSEGVDWNVYTEALTMSQAQYDAFHAVMGNNYRPVQPIHQRTVHQYVPEMPTLSPTAPPPSSSPDLRPDKRKFTATIGDREAKVVGEGYTDDEWVDKLEVDIELEEDCPSNPSLFEASFSYFNNTGEKPAFSFQLDFKSMVEFQGPKFDQDSPILKEYTIKCGEAIPQWKIFDPLLIDNSTTGTTKSTLKSTTNDDSMRVRFHWSESKDLFNNGIKLDVEFSSWKCGTTPGAKLGFIAEIQSSSDIQVDLENSQDPSKDPSDHLSIAREKDVPAFGLFAWSRSVNVGEKVIPFHTTALKEGNDTFRLYFSIEAECSSLEGQTIIWDPFLGIDYEISSVKSLIPLILACVFAGLVVLFLAGVLIRVLVLRVKRERAFVSV